MSESVNIQAGNFDQEVVQSKIPVLVDFWAEWCPPCKMIDPALEELAASYSGKVKFAKVNTDEQPEIAERFNIFSIPALLLFKGGNVVNRHVGAAPKPAIERIVSEVVH